MRLVLFIPWATIGASGWDGAELLPHRWILARELGVQDDSERRIQFLEQPADTDDTLVDAILPKRFVHEVRIAARQIRPIHGALAEAEFLDEQRETYGDLLTAGPGRHMDRLASKAGHRIGRLLRDADCQEGTGPTKAPAWRGTSVSVPPLPAGLPFRLASRQVREGLCARSRRDQRWPLMRAERHLRRQVHRDVPFLVLPITASRASPPINS